MFSVVVKLQWVYKIIRVVRFSEGLGKPTFLSRLSNCVQPGLGIKACIAITIVIVFNQDLVSLHCYCQIVFNQHLVSLHCYHNCQIVFNQHLVSLHVHCYHNFQILFNQDLVSLNCYHNCQIVFNHDLVTLHC